MPVESRCDGAFVFGYLDTRSADRRQASDTVVVKVADPHSLELRPERFGRLRACEISGEHGARVHPHAPTFAPNVGSLGLLLSGEAVLEQDGRRCPIAPGEFVLYAGDRPFRLELNGRHRWFVLSLDPGTAGHVCRRRELTANPLLPRSPLGRILSAMLIEVAGHAGGLGPVSRAEMGEHLGGLLHTLMRASDRQAGDAGLLERVLAHIDQHLAEALTPGRIASAHHLSVRSLHALFRGHGMTVGEHVRRVRLDRIRRDLTDPALAHLPAYAIAARWGMPDGSHFTKLFKAEFCVSPRELRRLASV
ncbi:helix-turn-helix domain-containing protein [Nonomuraea sp. NPDC004354]